MINGITSRMPVDSIEAVKMAIDFTKMQGETILKLINEQTQSTGNVDGSEGVGVHLDITM